jgi:hypothetical protein
MTFADFAALPVGVKALVVTLLWPAIWAGVSMTIALGRDVSRQRRMPAWSPTHRKAA